MLAEKLFRLSNLQCFSLESSQKDPYGNEGRYSGCFKVYGQKKDPLGNDIIKETTPEGRSIHWCPSIQI